MSAEDSDEPLSPTPRPEKLSRTPSWVMLGFVVGALFVWGLPREEAPPEATIQAIPTPTRVLMTPRLTTIEEVFAEWSRDAVWENDLTEVALWNTEVKSFSDLYEVLRVGDRFYFRSISQFTRPILTRSEKPASPLQFTEPQSRRDEWRRDRNETTFRAISEAARRNIPVPGSSPKPAPPSE